LRTADEPLETRAGADGGSPAVCDDRGVGLTVLLVDDHADFRASARALLEAEGFSVVGEAAGGAEALAAVRSLRPAVVLLDVQLPDIDGIEVAERLAAAGGAPAVVLTSGRDTRAYGARLKTAPARGFIAKAQLTGEALAALVR
jgi:DNA-binding NarL/FixJ family response regulator